MRKSFIETLINQARQNDNIWLLVADVGYNLVEPFRDEFPDRFINVGIAEQNMIGVATGLALSGKKVFCYSLANFPTLRCLEQIRNDVCYHNADVKIVSSGAGLMYGTLRFSHHATEDIAIMRALPNMTVICPCSPIEARLATEALMDYPKPAYLRLSRTGDTEVYQDIPRFELGKAIMVEAYQDVQVAILACGSIILEAIKAIAVLKLEGIKVVLISVPTVKPIDSEFIAQLSQKVKGIVTVEEHNLFGGLGSAVSETITDMGLNVKLVRIGIADCFSKEVGNQQYLREKRGLTAEHIVKKIKEILNG